MGTTWPRPSLRHHDQGVSVVISAVLVFALIVMVVAVYSATIVPDQIREKEAAHMRTVNSAMGDIATRLTQSSGLAAGGQYSQQVDLGTTSVAFFSAVESSGRLRMSGDAFVSTFSCNETKLVARDGAAAPGASFAPASGSMAVTEVLVLEFLVSFDDGDDTATVVAEGPDGAPLGRFELELDGSQGVVVRTFDGSGAPVVERVVQSSSGAIGPLRVDAMDRLYGFGSILDDAQGERTLTFSTLSGSSAAMEVYAVGRAPDGTVEAFGSGRELPLGFARSMTSATLVYVSQNHRFMDQTYVLEGGAVVLSQPMGEILSVAPFTLINPVGGSPYMRLGMVNLTGLGDTSGTHSATVTATVRAPVVSIIECTAPRVLLASEHLGAWGSAWAKELKRAGVSADALTSSSGFMAVSLPGTWFVELTEAQAELRLS